MLKLRVGWHGICHFSAAELFGVSFTPVSRLDLFISTAAAAADWLMTS